MRNSSTTRNNLSQELPPRQQLSLIGSELYFLGWIAIVALAAGGCRNDIKSESPVVAEVKVLTPEESEVVEIAKAEVRKRETWGDRMGRVEKQQGMDGVDCAIRSRR